MGDEAKGTAYFGLEFIPREQGGPAMLLGLEGVTSVEVPLSDAWSALLEISAGTTALRIGEQGGVGGNTDARVKLGFKRTDDATFVKQLIGDPKGTRLEIGPAEVTAQASASDLEVKVKLTDTTLVISPGTDGFLSSFMSSQGLRATLDLGLGYSFKRGGLFLDGGSGLLVTLPMHLRLGPVSVQALYVQLKGLENPSGLETELSIGFSVVLGPLTLTLDRFGLQFRVRHQTADKTKKPWDLDLGVKLPNGLGIAVDAKLVKGGGFLFFDRDNGMYAGALELAVTGVGSVAAVGVLQTRLPDGGNGFSLFILLSVQFMPGIALGPTGFFLTGLGGLLGLNRTVAVDALLDSVRTNAIDNILFPQDVVANAPTIISQVQTIFPPKRDQFIIGLMAQVKWGSTSLIELQMGLLVEFANPVRVAILGVLKILVPPPPAPSIIRFQLNFVGVLDFDQKLLAFDASLFDSRIGPLTLEGDMVVRLSWGAEPSFIASVGGFHPSYQPPASVKLPALRRLTITVLPSKPKLVVEIYLAITSNTFQVGAKVELTYKISKFTVVGYLGFDVLFQFSPFHFVASISAGLEVKVGSHTLFGITLQFELSGPGRWNAQGTARFKILFFTFKVKFNVSWGEGGDDARIAVQVQPLLAAAAADDHNWQVDLPANRADLVSLREIPTKTGEVVLQSFGSLKIAQNVLPLAFVFSRFGNDAPADLQQVVFAEVRFGGQPMPTEPVQDMFAPASFRELSDADKLSSQSFVKQQSGVRVTGPHALRTPCAANRPVAYEVHTSDFEPKPVRQPLKFQLAAGIFQALSLGGAISRSPLALEGRRQRFKVKPMLLLDETFAVASRTDLKAVAPGGSRADAQAALAAILAAHPERRNELHVVASYHLV